MDKTASLAARHPRLTILLSLLWLAIVAAFSFGLAVPAITVTKLRLFDSQFSILSGLSELAARGNWLVFGLILLFSVIVPYMKLALLASLWWRAPGDGHTRALDWLHGLSRWSMLDVLVVAVTLITLQSGFFVRTRLELGTYLFAAAAIASMALTGWVARAARVKDER